MSKIISIIPLPEHIKIYAEYKDEDGTPGYERIHFVGIVKPDNGDADLELLSVNEGICVPADCISNFVEYHISESWLKKLPSDFIEFEED